MSFGLRNKYSYVSDLSSRHSEWGRRHPRFDNRYPSNGHVIFYSIFPRDGLFYRFIIVYNFFLSEPPTFLGTPVTTSC